MKQKLGRIKAQFFAYVQMRQGLVRAAPNTASAFHSIEDITSILRASPYYV